MKIEARKNGKDVEDMFTFDRAYFKKGDPRNLYGTRWMNSIPDFLTA